MKTKPSKKQTPEPKASTSPDLNRFGRVAWNTHRNVIGGKAFNGDPLPTWEEMQADSSKAKIVAAWIEAARTVLHLYTLDRGQEIVKSGYAGCLPGGQIVDRRLHPSAVPIPANSLLGVPEPKLGIAGIVLQLLNEACAEDRKAITALINYRVPCTDALADHPTIVCGGKPVTVGMLGIINGIVERLSGERICARIEGKHLEGFRLYDHKAFDEKPARGKSRSIKRA